MTVWSLEWRAAVRRPRLFAWNVAVPALLLAPVALSAAAAPHRAAVFAVFYAFFGAFGFAIPLIRDASDGWIGEVLRSGYPVRAWIAERLAAATSLDLLQLAPATVLLLVASGASPATAAATLAALLLALLTANLVGALIAAWVRSLAEAALACAAASLILLHLAGAFRAPRPDGWSAAAAAWSPYRPLLSQLRSLGPAGPADAASWAAPALALTAALLLTLALAGRITARLRWPRGG